MAQLIKYENTKVDADKSAAELMALVQKYGGTRFEMQWEAGVLVGVRFAIAHKDLGEIPVRMSARTDEVRKFFSKNRPYSHHMRKTKAAYNEAQEVQAYRIAWRHLKDLCEQMLLAAELGIIEIHEAFMWAVEVEDPATGRVSTFGEFVSNSFHAVGSGGSLKLKPGTTAG